VSRHQSTIKLLKQIWPEAKVINHLENINEIPAGSLVIGNLPLTIVNKLINERGCRYVQVTLEVPPNLRGKELNEQELKKYMKLIEIQELKLAEFFIS